jgi:hypothetical protein
VSAGQQVAREAREPIERAAADLGGQRRGCDGFARGGRTKPDRQEALVPRNASEELHHPSPVAGAQQILHRFLHRVRDEAGANVEIPNKPPQGQLVDEGHYRVGERGEREEERNDEAEGESHLKASR